MIDMDEGPYTIFENETDELAGDRGYTGEEDAARYFMSLYGMMEPDVVKPTDEYSDKKLAIVFLDQKILNDIRDRCIGAAQNSEFQIHYRGLTVHLINEDFEVTVSVPTAFYNFNQEVTGGSVDYDLQEVEMESSAVKEISAINLHSNLEQLKIFGALEEAGFEVRFEEGDFGSIHRHPGRFGFSSIDLRNDPLFSGVIYRKKEAKNFFQNDSVMYIGDPKNSTEIFTSETRVLNLEGSPDGGTSGTYCAIPTITVLRRDGGIQKKIRPKRYWEQQMMISSTSLTYLWLWGPRTGDIRC